MGCSSSAGAAASTPTTAKYVATSGGSGSDDVKAEKTATVEPLSPTPADAGPRRTSKVVQDADCAPQTRSSPVNAKMVGLWRDPDGDVAHEFWQEDTRSGRLGRVPLQDLVQVPNAG
ncbi:unnamed protein product [Polarella glacialis]|uniref:Uncharacterized protein n=1 Tax=Polarella glacialis TaxID=89957 RepID=A0A813FUG2_POLGL|nr:unnamed protein product [Polarella glacialis]